MRRGILIGWLLGWACAITAAVIVSAWSGVAARQEARDNERLWAEIEEALRA